jgi:diguanylate cyclase (GGDEF)-like protein
MAIARALESAALTSSAIVGRFGGEEFILLLPDADAESLETAAQNIAAVLQAQNIPHAASPVSDRVTVSQGLALWQPGVSARELIAGADKALYQAKQEGRNRYK